MGSIGRADITDPAFRIYNQTEYFIDFEVNVDRLKMDCSGDIFGFNIHGDKTQFLFYYRRPSGKVLCKQHLTEYQSMMKGKKIVRIVATLGLPTKNVKSGMLEISGPFLRMQVGKACKAYFEHHCDLPQNYWAGTTPAEGFNQDGTKKSLKLSK